MKYYTSLAVAALLGNAQAIQVGQKAQTKMPHHFDVEENMELQIDQTLRAKESIELSQETAKCKAGINRFTNGTDNTW